MSTIRNQYWNFGLFQKHKNALILTVSVGCKNDLINSNKTLFWVTLKYKVCNSLMFDAN